MKIKLFHHYDAGDTMCFYSKELNALFDDDRYIVEFEKVCIAYRISQYAIIGIKPNPNVYELGYIDFDVKSLKHNHRDLTKQFKDHLTKINMW